MSVEDKFYNFIKFYKNLPYPIKNGIGKVYSFIPNKIKYGNFYFSYLNRISTGHYNYDYLLNKQLEFAVKNIPFYKQIDYKTIQDFPIINKAIIRRDFKSFINASNTNFIKANTGGSSGTPFEFYLEKGVSRPKEKAHFNWYWNQFGYKEEDKVLMIRGEALVNNKLYEFQAIENKLAISCYLINASNIDQVITIINKFKPKFIHAYPSALKSFIDCMRLGKKELKVKIESIFLGSEGLQLEDRKSISEYFNAKIAHWYGHSERLVHAGNCQYSDVFHLYPFYGYLELIDELNNVIEEPNKKGRIIATGFDNRVMPLIRYDTGDEAEYSKQVECQCGFKGKSLHKIHGRSQDYIFLEDQTKVSLTAFIFGQHFEEFVLIKEIQLEQTQYGRLLIRIIPQNINEFNTEGFIAKLKDSVNNKIKIKIEFVNHISKTERGKQIFLIQNIKN